MPAAYEYVRVATKGELYNQFSKGKMEETFAGDGEEEADEHMQYVMEDIFGTDPEDIQVDELKRTGIESQEIASRYSLRV